MVFINICIIDFWGAYIMRIRLSTSAGRSEFEFEGSVSEGTHIYYGNGHESYVTKATVRAVIISF